MFDQMLLNTKDTKSAVCFITISSIKEPTEVCREKTAFVLAGCWGGIHLSNRLTFFSDLGRRSTE